MPNGGQFSLLGGNIVSPLQEVTISGATTAIPGTAYACDAALNFQLSLPSAVGLKGQMIAARVLNGSNGQVTLKAAGAELIDGSNTRIIWQNENAVLMSDGTGWTKITGKTIPMGAQMTLAAAQLDLSGSFAQNTLALSTVSWDNASLAIPAQNKFRTRRFGRYAISGYVQLDGTSFAANIGRLIISYKFDALAPSLIVEENNINPGQYASPNIGRNTRISGDVDVRIIVQTDLVANTLDLPSAVVNLLELPEW